MIASSGTVLSNLAYLIGAVVVAVAGGLIVWLRHRQPRSVDANMASFKRGLSALAPDSATSSTRIHRSEQLQPRPVTGLTHVRLEPAGATPDAGADRVDPVGPAAPAGGRRAGDHLVEDRLEEVAAERSGGQAG